MQNKHNMEKQLNVFWGVLLWLILEVCCAVYVHIGRQQQNYFWNKCERFLF